MWKNVLIMAALGVLAFLWSDLLRFFERIGTREVAILLIIAGTIAATRVIKHMAKRL